MKRRLAVLTFLVLVVTVTSLTPGANADVVKSLSQGNCCYTWFGQNSVNQMTGRVGICFVASISGGATGVDFYMIRSSNAAGSMSAELYTTTGVIGQSPAGGTGCASKSTLISTSITVIDIGSLASNSQNIPSTEHWVFENGTITAGQKYIVVVLMTFTNAGAGSVGFGEELQSVGDPSQAYVDNAGQATQGALATSANDADEFTCGVNSTCPSYVFYGSTSNQPNNPPPQPAPPAASSAGVYTPVGAPVSQQALTPTFQQQPGPFVDSLPIIYIAVILFTLTLGAYLVTSKDAAKKMKQYELTV